MVRRRNIIFGTTTELNALPADELPGTFFFNTTTKEMYILDLNGRWYNVNGTATSNLLDYHAGV